MPKKVAESKGGLMPRHKARRACRPYSYLRKSRVLREQKVISPEMRLAEVRALVLKEGCDPDQLIVLST